MAKFNPQYHSTIPPEEFIRTKAEFLPMGKCLINPDYDETGTAQIVVERIHPGREITVGVYIIDLLCEGIIDTFFLFKQNKFKLIHELKEGGMEDLKSCSYELAHSIIYGASKYATSIGLLDCADFELTRYILKDEKTELAWQEVEFGQDNRPLVLVFEDDDKKKLIQKLSQTIGRENFDIMDTGGNLIETSKADNKKLQTLLAASYDIFDFRSANEILELQNEILPADDAILILTAISSFQDGSSEAFALGRELPETVQARILEFLFLKALYEKKNENFELIDNELFTRVLGKNKMPSPFDIPKGKINYGKQKNTEEDLFAEKTAKEIKQLFDTATSANDFFADYKAVTEKNIEDIYAEATLYNIAMGYLQKAQQYFDALEKINIFYKVGNEIFSALMDAKLEYIS